MAGVAYCWLLFATTTTATSAMMEYISLTTLGNGACQAEGSQGARGTRGLRTVGWVVVACRVRELYSNVDIDDHDDNDNDDQQRTPIKSRLRPRMAMGPHGVWHERWKWPRWMRPKSTM